MSDLLKYPYDEGAKVVAKNLFEQFKAAELSDFSVIKGGICSLLTIGKLLECRAEYVLYLPSQSITFNSFLRAKLINLISRKKVVLVSTQPKNFKTWQKKLICKIQPYKIFVQSIELKDGLKKIGLKNVFVNSWGVDLAKFKPVDSERKNAQRKKYNIPTNKRIYLHFGHLNKERNFDELECVINADKNNYVLIVCSTTTEQKVDLKKKLSKKGFRFITDYVENNQELYQLADYYVFPTIDQMAASEFPLSVLEALACKIPVFCKRFGFLKDIETKNYSNIRFYSRPEELLDTDFSDNNPFPIQEYSWESVTKDLIEKIEN